MVEALSPEVRCLVWMVGVRGWRLMIAGESEEWCLRRLIRYERARLSRALTAM